MFPIFVNLLCISIHYISSFIQAESNYISIMSHTKRTGGNYLFSPKKKIAIKPDPDTPSTITSKSTQSSRSTIGTTVNAFCKSAKFDSSDDEVEVVENQVKSPTADEDELLLQEIDWFDSESLTHGVIAFCDKPDVERAHTMKDGEKVRAIFRAHTPQTLKMVYQGVAQGSGCMSMSDVMTFFRDEIKGNQQRDRLGDAMVTLLKTISKRDSVLKVNSKVTHSEAHEATKAIAGGSASSPVSKNASAKLKSGGDEASRKDNDSGSLKSSDTGKNFKNDKKVAGVSFSPRGGGVIEHNDEGGQDDEHRDENGNFYTENTQFSNNDNFDDGSNRGGHGSESKYDLSDNALENNPPLDDNDPQSNEVDPLSDEIDPLGDDDFLPNAAPVSVNDAVDKYPIKFSKPFISADGTLYYVFFFAGRYVLWYMKSGYMRLIANGVIKSVALTHTKLVPGLLKVLVPSFTETKRRIPGDPHDKLIKTQKGNEVPIVFGVMDLKPDEGISIEQKAETVFDLVFKAGFKMYPNAKVSRGSRFLTWCNENGHDGLTAWLVKDLGEGNQTTAENVISVEMNNCFNKPGVEFEWNTPLDQFLPDYEIKRFLVNYIKATGWEGLSESNKEACYRAYATIGMKRLPNWNTMVKTNYRNN